MRLAVSQTNPTVGALRENVEKLLASAAQAQAQGAALWVAPELAVCGYPPRDLLDSPGFVKDCLQALRYVVQRAPLPMLLGAVVSTADDPCVASAQIANGAVLIVDQRVQACHHKHLLPSYDVFDETRYFRAGTQPTVFTLQDTCIGVSICEDIWRHAALPAVAHYQVDPIAMSLEAGAQLLINLSASPYARHKMASRLQVLQACAQRSQRAILYVNQVGGNDSLIFDGASMALDAQGAVTWRLPAYTELLGLTEWQSGRCCPVTPTPVPPAGAWEADVTAALCLGLRDYLRKCGFQRVVLGLSGGIDSAVVASLAVRALGPQNVVGIAMPSRYSSPGSQTDAYALADNLGIRCDTLPIEGLFASALALPSGPFAPPTTEPQAALACENLQSRLRGLLLMGYANRHNWLLLSTGNKSELAVGYCTLYGDMCGALAPLSDLYKTQVYALARYLNHSSPTPPIPPASLSKAPSAELRPAQTDQDSLPDYATLDAVLYDHLEAQHDHAQLRATYGTALVERVLALLQRSEYKRRQMAPGLRVSDKAFGEGRRLPLAQGYTPFHPEAEI